MIVNAQIKIDTLQVFQYRDIDVSIRRMAPQKA